LGSKPPTFGCVSQKKQEQETNAAKEKWLNDDLLAIIG